MNSAGGRGRHEEPGINRLPPARNGGAHPERWLQPAEGKRDRCSQSLLEISYWGYLHPWGSEEKLIAKERGKKQALSSDKTSQQRDDELEGDEREPSEEVIFGQRRPDSLAIDWINKMVYVLEVKRTSDQRRDYREKGEARARAQHDVLIRSLEKVAGETESHCKKDIPVYRLLPHCLLQQPARGPCSGGGNDWHGLLLKACRYCSLG